MQMASKAMGRLAHTGGTFTADYVEFEVKRALEWLGGDRNEGRRHAAVSKFHIDWYHIYMYLNLLHDFSITSGCKEKHFYSLPFGQAEASIY